MKFLLPLKIYSSSVLFSLRDNKENIMLFSSVRDKISNFTANQKTN